MRMTKQASRIVLIVCTLMLATLVPHLFAQVESGRISGTVKDSTGAFVASATITITNTATSIATTVQSGTTGFYIFQAVKPGNYTLKAEAEGFQQFVSQGVEAHVQQNTSIDVTLSVGTTRQTVTVTAAAPLLQAEDASIGQTIDEQQVNNMPLVSRDWTTLANLSAGVTSSAGGNSADTMFTVNGINSTENDFRLNGIDDNEEMYGGGQFTFEATFMPPPDAIQEFKLQTGDFTAEIGRTTGAVENAVIKSGTNGLHGDLWEYVRNTVFNAENYFTAKDVPKPAYHQNQFGGTVGGPLFIPKVYNGKNKTFFFFDYQGSRVSKPSIYTSAVPTANMHSSNFTNYQDNFTLFSGFSTDGLGRKIPFGAFLDPATTRTVAAGTVDPISGLTNTGTAAVPVRDPFYTGGGIGGITDFTGKTDRLNVLPASRLDANAQKLLALYPNPTLGLSAGPNNYQQFTPFTSTINQFDIRIDENISSKDIFFAVFDLNHSTNYAPPSLPGLAEGAQWGDGPEFGPRYGGAMGYTHVFTPTLTNEAHAGWQHSIEHLGGPFPNTMGIPAQFGIGGVPQVPGNGGLPYINISGLSTEGGTGWMPTLQTLSVLEVMDNVTKIYGSHAFKAGFQIDRIYSPVIQPSIPKGQFTYTGMFSDIPNSNSGYIGQADMLLTPIPSTLPSTVPGRIDNLGGLSYYGISTFATVRDQRYYGGGYLQDDWKVRRNLTLNLGIRWDHYTPYYERLGQQANFIQNAGDAEGGTYYIPQEGCASTKTSTGFQALLASYNIGINCTSNKATGLAQDSNFAPRVGFAYSITPHTVLRGGYGIAYGAMDNIGFGGTLGTNYPFMFQVGSPGTTSQVPLTVPGGQTAVLENSIASLNLSDPTKLDGSGLSLSGRQWNFMTPYSQTLNLTIQDQFTSHDSISAAYVGTLGRHLDSNGTQNAPSAIMPPGTNEYDTTVQGHIPFPELSANSTLQRTNSTSSYHSMQVVYQHQLSAGLSVLANYTFAKCMTSERAAEGQGGLPGYRAEWLPGFGQKADYALCSTDAAQVIHGSGTYNVPIGRGRTLLKDTNRVTDMLIGGWVTNFIYSYQSGQPFTVGCPNTTTQDFGCFAPMVQGQNPYAGPHNATQWLNPAAFSLAPAATTIGQTDFAPLGGKPEQVRGPGLKNLDMSLFKNFTIREATKVEFRAEAFNLGNWAEFGTPGNLDYRNTQSFSTITATRGDARILQLALKLYF